MKGWMNLLWLTRSMNFRPRPGFVEIIAVPTGFSVTDNYRKQTVRAPWHEVRRVTVITAVKGPYNDRRFYHVVFDSGEVTMPAGAKGADEFVARLKAQPDFDAKAWTTAETAPLDSYVVVLGK